MEETPRFPSLLFRQRLNATVLPMLGGIALFLLLDPLIADILLIASSLAAVYFVCKREGETRKILLCILLGVSAALVLMGLRGLKEADLRALCGTSHSVEGYVVSCEEGAYELELSRLGGEDFHKRIRVETKKLWRMGEKRSLTVTLFSLFPKNYRSEGVDYFASLREDRGVVGKSYLYTLIGSVRERVKEDFAQRENGGYLQAIILGDREGLTEAQTAAFRKTASSHLLAISGLHISQAVSFLVCFLNLMPVSRKAVRLLLYPFVLILFLLAGAGVSVFRASVMTLFSMTGLLLRHRSDSVTALSFSAALLTLANPYTLENPSFLFSYASTFGLVTCAVPLGEYFRDCFDKKNLHPVLKALRAVVLAYTLAVVAFTFTLPVQLILYESASPFAPLYALLLIPIFQISLVLALLGASLISFSALPAVRLLLSLAASFPEFVEFLAKGAPLPVDTGEASLVIALLFLAALTVAFVKRLPLTAVFLLHGVSFLFWGYFSIV